MSNDIRIENENEGYQIMIVNIHYGKVFDGKIKSRPEMAIFDVPVGIMKTKENDEMFKLNVEAFAYNTLTRKYGAEVENCQVYLPLD